MRFSVFLFCALGLLLSCTKDAIVFSEFKTLPNTWNKDSIVTFTLEPKDTVAKHNVFINLRNNSAYAYSNLFLIANLEYPNGKNVTDTLEYHMAYPNGEYIGEGFGDVKENKLWYKEGIIFDESGNYRLSLRQAMRKNGNTQAIENLKGVTEVGIQVESNNTK